MAASIPDKPLASGRTADIYPWSEGEVVKLFHAWVPPGDVEVERQKAAAAYAMGLATPAVGSIVQVDGRVGLVYQQVVGRSMLEQLMSEPESAERSARLLAKLHKQLHGRRPGRSLPDLGDLLKAKISTRPELSDAERSALLGALARLRSGDTFCHGDFHPGNVVVTEGGPVIIDWLTAGRGSPMADVARTSLLFLDFVDVAESAAAAVAADYPAGSARLDAQSIARFHQTYMQEYMQDEPGLLSEYEQWLPIMAAARLSEGIEGRQEWLVRQVRNGLIYLRNTQIE